MNRTSIAILVGSLLLLASCTKDCEIPGAMSKNFVIEKKNLSPDNLWILLSGSEDIAGGFGTGSSIKAVYMKRNNNLDDPREVFESSEDEGGAPLRIDSKWNSANSITIQYRGGSVDLETTKLAGLSISTRNELE